MRTVKIEPINSAAFESFGTVLGPTNDGVRRDHYDVISSLRSSAQVNLAQVRADDRSLDTEIIVEKLERHEFSSQSFFPLNVKRYLVVVCKSGGDGLPSVDGLLAFSVPGSVGVSYKPNIWHLGISVLEGGGDFLMLVHENGTPGDCEFVDIESVRIML